ncbi:transposase [Streptomyces sp. NPDC051940]|uniref:transposase n=1 Tax=Streptomyces sp. NPDC051940 TaxID=3155675 RepID=UPI00341FFCC0
MNGWICFEDEAGQSLRPTKVRIWGRRGHTPVVWVHGRRGKGKVTIAGLACYRHGQRSRFLRKQHIYRGRKGETKSLTWRDYCDLPRSAHVQLGAPIVLVWDNLSVHLHHGMQAFIERTDWLTVFQLPPYAPELNPAEGLWSVIKGGVLANLAAAGLEHLTRVIRRGLKMIQYRPDLVDGCLAATGLT